MITLLVKWFNGFDRSDKLLLAAENLRTALQSGDRLKLAEANSFAAVVLHSN